jgi:hypothetical protein
MRTIAKWTTPLLLAVLLTSLPSQAQTVPTMINYQGRVTVAGTPVDAAAFFKFALVDGDGTTATTTYWSNDGTSTGGSEPTSQVTLTVNKGLYAVLLGDAGMPPITVTVFSDHANVRLRVWFSQTSGGPYTLLTPDARIVSVGYAMLAGTVPDGAITAAKLASGLASSGATPLALVQRDGSGDFEAGSVTLAGELALPASAGAGVGVITINGTPALHTHGTQNSFVGGSGNFTTSGARNTANGFGALVSNTTGTLNTADGVDALFSNTTGTLNTANGADALYANTIGGDNTATGARALQSNTDGSGNTASGVFALAFNTTGSRNTADGTEALYSNTIGWYNTAAGYDALYANTTGDNNTAAGVFTLYSNTTGQRNTAQGSYALTGNLTGADNTASGHASLGANTTGSANTADGVYALYQNTTGDNNTATGYSALDGNTTGYNNTALGVSALRSNSTGNNNIAVGYEAGSNLTTGDNNIDIGHLGVAGESSTIRIGTDVLHSTTYLAGDVYAVSFNSTSDRNAKADVEAVEPTTVLEKVAALPISTWRFKQQADTRHLGPMAQDFHAAFGLGTDDRHIATVDADGVALAAIQGLNLKLKEREQEIAELRQSLAELQQIVGGLVKRAEDVPSAASVVPPK